MTLNGRCQQRGQTLQGPRGLEALQPALAMSSGFQAKVSKVKHTVFLPHAERNTSSEGSQFGGQAKVQQSEEIRRGSEVVKFVALNTVTKPDKGQRFLWWSILL